MKRKKLVISLVLGFVTGVILSLTLLKRGGNDGRMELGPEETVEMFCRAVASGDFEGAYTLCDTVAMKTYIETYSKTWSTMRKQDSRSLEIASGILTDMQIIIDDVKKDGKTRSIFFRIEAGDGLSKQKAATVVKEEGEWKVLGIADRQ